MKTRSKIAILAMLFLLLTDCKTEDIYLKALDDILPDRYYSTDIIPKQFSNIYGTWKVTSISGGFIKTGTIKDFDFLILKRNGIFGIIRNDSLITYGKLTLLPEITMFYVDAVYCRFDFEKPANILLYTDSEKYIRLLNKDSLELDAPCCDRSNIYLIRKK